MQTMDPSLFAKVYPGLYKLLETLGRSNLQARVQLEQYVEGYAEYGKMAEFIANHYSYQQALHLIVDYWEYVFLPSLQ